MAFKPIMTGEWLRDMKPCVKDVLGKIVGAEICVETNAKWVTAEFPLARRAVLDPDAEIMPWVPNDELPKAVQCWVDIPWPNYEGLRRAAIFTVNQPAGGSLVLWAEWKRSVLDVAVSYVLNERDCKDTLVEFAKRALYFRAKTAWDYGHKDPLLHIAEQPLWVRYPDQRNHVLDAVQRAIDELEIRANDRSR